MRQRCPWSLGVSDEYQAYHDEEWGLPVLDDAVHFEFLILESAQAGLSWRTVLHKREGYRLAFAGFDPVSVALFGEPEIEALVADPGIIRNRQKITAAVNNASRFLEVCEEFGSFARYIWGFANGKPVVNRWRSQNELPATSELSDRLSADLKARGFKFVGSTIMYSHLQACGLINDHLVSCFRHRECRDAFTGLPGNRSG
ncbi:MAG: DNA-3-methyladenine glycosylase I [Gammaproteobacteria bacterium]|nr:DNA-3-methyladenine glycosylase I [Gammaproteobacteria bacterium]